VPKAIFVEREEIPMKASASLALVLLLLVPSAGGLEELRPEEPATLPAEGIPPRPAGAMTGTEFARRTTGMAGRARQRLALAALTGGDLPDFLRQLKPVTLEGHAPDGRVTRAVIWVTPDYLTIGSDRDFLRIPLSYYTATAVARAFGCVLPTRKMVDAIYRQADLRLPPQPLPAGPRMRSSAYYLRHQRMIEAQRDGQPLGELVAGQKKDIVLTNRLYRNPNRIAIYGWHKRRGQPIQPLSTVHGAGYADYSHGVRLVSETVWIDGVPRSIYDVLADPELAPALSDEGPLRDPRRLMAPKRPDR
jgi:hypothetical protein